MSVKKDNQNKTKKYYSVLWILAGIYAFIGITNITTSLAGSIIAFIFALLIANAGYKNYQKVKHQTAQKVIIAKVVDSSKTSDGLTATAEFADTETAQTIRKMIESNILIDTKDHVLDYTIKSYRVAGANHYKKNIMEVAYENDYYSMTKKQIVDAGMEDERIWKYEVSDLNAYLVPEPDNKHDPNAIMVMVEGLLVGYVEAVSCIHLLDLIENDRILDITAEVCGGPYKVVTEDGYDYNTGKDTYSVERGSHDFSIELTIKEKKK